MSYAAGYFFFVSAILSSLLVGFVGFSELATSVVVFLFAGLSGVLYGFIKSRRMAPVLRFSWIMSGMATVLVFFGIGSMFRETSSKPSVQPFFRDPSKSPYQSEVIGSLALGFGLASFAIYLRRPKRTEE